MLEETNPWDTSVKTDGKRNTPCMSKVLRENMDVTEFTACNKADDFKDKKRKEDIVNYVHRGLGESTNCEWIYAKQEKLI